MSDLSPRARAIIDQARDADGPSPADRARIRAALYAQIGLLGSVAGSGDAGAGGLGAGDGIGAAAGAAGSTGAAKLALAVMVALGLGIGGYFLASKREPVPPGAEPAVSLAPAPSPLPEVSPAPAEIATPAPASTPDPVSPDPVPADPVSVEPAPADATPGLERSSARRSKPRSAPRARSSSPGSINEPGTEPRGEPKTGPEAEPAGSTVAALGEESRLIRDARRALREGDAATALQRMIEHQERFRDGQLVQERQALRIIALCKLDRVEQARREATMFTSRWPSSPHGARIRASCPAL